MQTNIANNFALSDLSTYRERCWAISSKRGIAIFGSSFGSNESRRRLDDLTSACKKRLEAHMFFLSTEPSIYRRIKEVLNKKHFLTNQDILNERL